MLKIPFDSAFPRICPGKDFALRTIFINIAFILAVFDIEAPAGQKIEPKFHVAAVRCVVFLFFFFFASVL